MVLFLATIPSLLTAREHRSLSSIPVRDVAVKGRTVDVISQLAMKYHVVTGIYGIDINGNHEPTIEVSIKNGTLGTAYDAIAKADPRIEWHQSSDTVHFTTRNFPITLMDLTIKSFDAESDQRYQILAHLEDAPEVHAWLLENKCPPANRRAVASMGGNDSPPIYISVHARNLPYSSIMDQIAAQSRVYFWSVERSIPSPCPTYSTWAIE